MTTCLKKYHDAPACSSTAKSFCLCQQHALFPKLCTKAIIREINCARTPLPQHLLLPGPRFPGIASCCPPSVLCFSRSLLAAQAQGHPHWIASHCCAGSACRIGLPSSLPYRPDAFFFSCFSGPLQSIHTVISECASLMPCDSKPRHSLSRQEGMPQHVQGKLPLKMSTPIAMSICKVASRCLEHTCLSCI